MIFVCPDEQTFPGHRKSAVDAGQKKKLIADKCERISDYKYLQHFAFYRFLMGKVNTRQYFGIYIFYRASYFIQQYLSLNLTADV